MGYRIEYDGRIDKYEVVKKGSHGLFMLSIGAVGLFLIGTLCFWPQGAAVIRDFLIPGENAVTAAAFTAMRNDLRCGANLRDAVYTFCHAVIYGA